MWTNIREKQTERLHNINKTTIPCILCRTLFMKFHQHKPHLLYPPYTLYNLHEMSILMIFQLITIRLSFNRYIINVSRCIAPFIQPTLDKPPFRLSPTKNHLSLALPPQSAHLGEPYAMRCKTRNTINIRITVKMRYRRRRIPNQQISIHFIILLSLKFMGLWWSSSLSLIILWKYYFQHFSDNVVCWTENWLNTKMFAGVIT